jgi:hypothetical protein
LKLANTGLLLIMLKRVTLQRATFGILGLSLMVLTGCPKSDTAPSAATRPPASSSASSAASATAQNSASPSKLSSLNDRDAVSTAASTDSFSLEGRRTIEQYDQKMMPGFVETLTKSCVGSNIKIAIDWNTLGSGSEGSATIEALTNSNAINRSVESLTQAFQNICADDMGRKAVASKVTLIKVQHAKDAKEPSFSFANGVVTLQLNVNKSDSPWTQDLQKMLTAGL